MRPTPKPLFLLSLMLCAACAKPGDISVARREHILAGPHGWIDLTLRAPAPVQVASAPVSASSTAKAAPLEARCDIVFTVDGEPMVDERGDLAQADAASNPLGYRFAAPVGALRTELLLRACVATPLRLPLPLPLQDGQLVLLTFDGRQLSVTGRQAWQPATLDGLRDALSAVQRRGDAAYSAMSTLKALVGASVLLNVLALTALLVALRRRRPVAGR